MRPGCKAIGTMHFSIHRKILYTLPGQSAGHGSFRMAELAALDCLGILAGHKRMTTSYTWVYH